MTWLLIGAIVVETALVLYLLRGRHQQKKKYNRLYEKYKAGQKTILELQEQEQDTEEQIDKLATHDIVVELFESGADVEEISKQLEIPQSKVEMTLRFEKMKKYGSQ